VIDERTEFGARAARVTFHFDGDGGGGDIIVFTGTATVDPELPPADQSPEYLEKYHGHIARLGMTPERFAATYGVPVRIRFTRLDGH
jgi:PPOX class probable F420-dependent enzyme